MQRKKADRANRIYFGSYTTEVRQDKRQSRTGARQYRPAQAPWRCRMVIRSTTPRPRWRLHRRHKALWRTVRLQSSRMTQDNQILPPHRHPPDNVKVLAPMALDVRRSVVGVLVSRAEDVARDHVVPAEQESSLIEPVARCWVEDSVAFFGVDTEQENATGAGDPLQLGKPCVLSRFVQMSEHGDRIDHVHLPVSVRQRRGES